MSATEDKKQAVYSLVEQFFFPNATSSDPSEILLSEELTTELAIELKNLSHFLEDKAEKLRLTCAIRNLRYAEQKQWQPSWTEGVSAWLSQISLDSLDIDRERNYYLSATLTIGKNIKLRTEKDTEEDICRRRGRWNWHFADRETIGR